MTEEKKILVDVEGADHLALDHGERYQGWYASKTFVRDEVLPLDYKDTTYKFAVCDFNYRFVMPMKIEFAGGLISYSDGDRTLGVFRFPRDENGDFVAPISLKPKSLNDVVNFSDAEIKEILSRKEPLVFNAYKIPQFGFEFLDLSNDDIQQIVSITDREFGQKVLDTYQSQLKLHVDEILAKIASSPNFLLILQNILDKKLKDLNETALMTDNIIHIE